MKKNGSIQILRAVAALLVVHVHALDMASHFGRVRQLDFVGHWSSCGVDIFFAISGFILSTVALNARPAVPGRLSVALDFLFRRFLRIFPIFWVLLLFYVVLQFAHHVLTCSLLVDSFLLLPSLHYPMRAPLNPVGWTLLFEMFFYYLITLNLAIGRRFAVERTVLSIVVLLAAGALFGFRHPVLILIANPMNLEFTFGCAVGLLYARQGIRRPAGLASVLAGAALLVSSLFWSDPGTGLATHALDGSLSWYRTLIWGIPTAMITGGLVFLAPATESRIARFGVYLGDASYSIYLVSLMVLYFYERFYPHVARLGGDLNGLFAFLCVVVAGCLCFNLLERPMTRLLTSRYHRTAVQSAP